MRHTKLAQAYEFGYRLALTKMAKKISDGGGFAPSPPPPQTGSRKLMPTATGDAAFRAGRAAATMGKVAMMGAITPAQAALIMGGTMGAGGAVGGAIGAPEGTKLRTALIMGGVGALSGGAGGYVGGRIGDALARRALYKQLQAMGRQV
jgi:hypothetical protein